MHSSLNVTEKTEVGKTWFPHRDRLTHKIGESGQEQGPTLALTFKTLDYRVSEVTSVLGLFS